MGDRIYACPSCLPLPPPPTPAATAAATTTTTTTTTAAIWLPRNLQRYSSHCRRGCTFETVSVQLWRARVRVRTCVTLGRWSLFLCFRASWSHRLSCDWPRSWLPRSQSIPSHYLVESQWCYEEPCISLGRTSWRGGGWGVGTFRSRACAWFACLEECVRVSECFLSLWCVLSLVFCVSSLSYLSPLVSGMSSRCAHYIPHSLLVVVYLDTFIQFTAASSQLCFCSLLATYELPGV